MKKLLVGILVLSLAVLGMSGCKKEMTVEEILKTCQENVAEYTTMEGDMRMEMDASISAQGIELDMGVSMDMGMKIQRTEAQELSHIKGDVELEILGQTLSEAMESYTVVEGSTVKSYNYTSGEWIYMEATQEESASMAESMDIIYGEAANWVLSEETVEKDGKACYELKGVITGDNIQSLLEMGESMDFSEMGDMSKAELPVTLYVDEESCYPVAILLEAGEGINTVFEGTEAEGSEFSVFNIAFENIRYNGEVKIEIPEEALAAEAGGSLMLEEEMTEGEYEEEYVIADDEAKAAEATAAGEYILTHEDTTNQLHLDWPDDCECYFISEFGMVGLMNDQYELNYEMYPKAYEYVVADMQGQTQEWVDWCKEDAETYANLTVSDEQTMTTADGYTYHYVTMAYDFAEISSYLDYMGWIEYDDCFLMVTTSFYEPDGSQDIMQEIISKIALVK